MPEILLNKKISDLSSKCAPNKRILFDFTVSHKWLKSGYMVGIARECQELFNEFDKKNLTEIVFIESDKNGIPLIRKINKKTYNVTGEIIHPCANDIILTIDIQIRGVHVPYNHPSVGYFEKFGVERYAVVNDILPIIYPEYFEKETSLLMPSYILNIFKNYNKIFCISKATYDTLMVFCKYYQIKPLDITLNSYSNGRSVYPMFYGDYICNGESILCGSELSFNFFVPNTDGDINLSFVANTSAFSCINMSIFVNNRFLSSSDIKRESKQFIFTIKKEELSKYGLQEIKFVPNKKKRLLHKKFKILFQKICISSVNQKSYTVKNIINNNIDIDYLHLGVTKFNKTKSQNKINDFIIDFFKNKKVFLMVGTVEPRKGHSFVLDAFDEIWRQGHDLCLCIIGKIGWNVLSLVNKIKKQQKDRVIFLENASDSILQFAYENSFCLIQASVDEGFGLPLIEASQFNIPILCSDIPVFREIAGNNAIYFNRNNINDLIEKIFYITNSANANIIPNSSKINYNSWSQCADNFIDFFYGEKRFVTTIHKQQQNNHFKKRQKMLVSIMFSIFPPTSGGQVRVFGLYKELAKYFDVEILAFSPSYTYKKSTEIAPGLVETLIPKTSQQELREIALSNKLGVSSTDLFIMMHGDINGEYMSALSEKCAEADYIVASHAYMFPLIKKVANLNNKCLIYEAQDVEYIVKTGMMVNTSFAKSISKTLFDIEKECCERSNFILTCSKEDSDNLFKLYNVNKDKIFLAPNGVDTSIVKFANVEQRIKNKKKYGIESETFGLFLGSSYPPNINACEAIISIAEECKSVIFLLVGSVCDKFLDKKLPQNVGLIGRVSENEKLRLLSTADFAINNVVSGSGTNIKMFDYMAAGIPIITTNFGSRGIENKELFTIIDKKRDFINYFNNFNFSVASRNINKARNYVEEMFDWSIIAKKVYEKIK